MKNKIFSLATLLSLTTVACSSDKVVQLPGSDEPGRFWALRSSFTSVVMAVNGTQMIDVVALDSRGNEMTDLTGIKFRSLDTNTVSVDDNGMMTARQVRTSGISVVASLQVDGVTRADTMTVYVTATETPIKSIGFATWFGTPVVGEMDLRSTLSFNVAVKDTFNNDVYGLNPSVVAEDPGIVMAGFGFAYGSRLGRTRIIASLNAYGRDFVDTLTVTVLLPTIVNLSLYSAPSDNISLATGGRVIWQNYMFPQKTVNITFDDPSNIVGGNVDAILPNGSAERQFPVPGTYAYKDTLNKTRGYVIVRDQAVYKD